LSLPRYSSGAPFCALETPDTALQSDLTVDRQALFAPLRLCALISAVKVTVAVLIYLLGLADLLLGECLRDIAESIDSSDDQLGMTTPQMRFLSRFQMHWRFLRLRQKGCFAHHCSVLRKHAFDEANYRVAIGIIATTRSFHTAMHSSSHAH
jgi:hypothetical protein